MGCQISKKQGNQNQKYMLRDKNPSKIISRSILGEGSKSYSGYEFIYPSKNLMTFKKNGGKHKLKPFEPVKIIIKQRTLIYLEKCSFSPIFQPQQQQQQSQQNSFEREKNNRLFTIHSQNQTHLSSDIDLFNNNFNNKNNNNNQNKLKSSFGDDLQGNMSINIQNNSTKDKQNLQENEEIDFLKDSQYVVNSEFSNSQKKQENDNLSNLNIKYNKSKSNKIRSQDDLDLNSNNQSSSNNNLNLLQSRSRISSFGNTEIQQSQNTVQKYNNNNVLNTASSNTTTNNNNQKNQIYTKKSSYYSCHSTTASSQILMNNNINFDQNNMYYNNNIQRKKQINVDHMIGVLRKRQERRIRNRNMNKKSGSQEQQITSCENL